jgi:hypothetical protein
MTTKPNLGFKGKHAELFPGRAKIVPRVSNEGLEIGGDEGADLGFTGPAAKLVPKGRCKKLAIYHSEKAELHGF